MNRRIGRLRTVLVVAGTALALSGCGRKGGDDAGGEAKSTDAVTVPVSARAIEERSFEDAVTAPGQWISTGEVTVNAPFDGVVDSLFVRPGDRVRAGQVLLRMVTRESRSALLGAEILAGRSHDETERAEAARALDLARRDLVRVPVHAPHAGIVTGVVAQSGSEVAESAAILSIQAPDAIVFEARVAPEEASRIRAGEDARVTDTGTTDARPAVVLRVLPAASAADQATLAWLAPRGVAPGSAADPPETGRFGTARITTGSARRASAVPDSAIVEDDVTGQTRVAVIDPDRRAIWTPVTLGAGADKWHEVRSPSLPPGTLVVTEGQRGLPDSTRVELKAR